MDTDEHRFFDDRMIDDEWNRESRERHENGILSI